jgi:YHS domain-containing protein
MTTGKRDAVSLSKATSFFQIKPLTKPTNTFRQPKSEDSDSTCSCQTQDSTDFCYTNSVPVLGGLDFVQYFTEFKNEDGTYDETRIGSKGSTKYSSIYNGYTFLFLNPTNKALFDKNPESYLPQWGGFCAWGIAAEFCPPYSWDADCLGPHGNWGHWTIQEGKLYFFWFAAAREKFIDSVNTSIPSGDNRWGGWFPGGETSIFSTNCYDSTVDDDSN